MNLSELLNSTNQMGGTRTVTSCLGKQFGDIYIGNKEVAYNPQYNEVEVVLYFGSRTQKDVSLHKAMIVLKDIKQYEMSTSELVDYLKQKLGIKLFDYVYDEVLNKMGKDLSAQEDNEYMRQYLMLVKEEFEAPYTLRIKKSDIYRKYDESVYESRELSEIRRRIRVFGKLIHRYEKRRSKKFIQFDREKLEKSIPLDVIQRGGAEFEQATAIYDDVIKRELKWKQQYPAMKQEFNRLIKREEELTSRFEVKTLSGRRLLQEEGFKRTDEYQTRKEAFLHNLPDELIIQVAIENPFIVSSKVIVPKDGYSFLIVDKEISLNTEVRVSCSCFTGDTRVQLANGMSLSLKDLENMTDFKVLAYNTEIGKYEYARALNCTKRQENARIIKITLADGTSIRVTPSHRFLNSGCEWKQAQELQVGDLLKFNNKYWGYENHEQKTSSSTFIYLDPTQEGDYQFGELKFTHRPFYVGVTTGAFVKIENEKCLEYLNKLADLNEQPLMFKQYYHVDEHVALQLKEKLVNRIGTIEQGSLLVNNTVQVNDNFINENDDCIAITNIEELQEREDVYCLTVEGLGNFAIQTNKGNIIVENCADYYWTYSWANSDHRVNRNNRPPTYANTEYRGYAIRNPEGHAGCCKHIVMLIAHLMKEGLIRDRGSIVKTFNKESNTLVDVNYLGYKSKAGKHSFKRDSEDIQKAVNDLDKELKEFNLKAKEAGSEVTANMIVSTNAEAKSYADPNKLLDSEYINKEEIEKYRSKYGNNILNNEWFGGFYKSKKTNYGLRQSTNRYGKEAEIKNFRNSIKNDLKGFKKWKKF